MSGVDGGFGGADAPLLAKLDKSIIEHTKDTLSWSDSEMIEKSQLPPLDKFEQMYYNAGS